MNEVKLRKFFTFLTNFARFLTVYPVILFCFEGILKQQGHPILPYTALAIVLAFASLGVTKFLRERVKRLIGLRLAQLAMLLVSAAAGVGLCILLDGTGWMCMYSGIVLAVYSALGGLFAALPLKRYEFFIVAGVYIFVVAVLIIIRGFAYPVQSFILQFLFICAVFALELNFQNIDFLMQRRGHQMSHLPGKIRMFNLLLLGGGLVLLVVLVLCRGFFMDAAGMLLRGIGAVLAFVFGPLRRWWDNIPDSGDQHFGEIKPDWEGDPDNAFEQLVGDDSGGNVNVDTQVDILFFLFFAIVIFCLIYFRRTILDALRRMWRWLSEQFWNLFQNIGKNRNFGHDENEYFTDQEEVVEGSTLLSGSYSALRAWRRDLRAYQKLPDGRQKYLAGWALSVRGLQLHGVQVRASDTPREILGKASEILDSESYGIATECCNALAFGVHEQQPAWTELKAALELLRNRKIQR